MWSQLLMPKGHPGNPEQALIHFTSWITFGMKTQCLRMLAGKVVSLAPPGTWPLAEALSVSTAWGRWVWSLPLSI